MKKISTIGYERASLDDFIDTLRKAEVDTLLDVRELPISRRKGFAKRALREALHDAGIEYIHEKDLGSPKWLRDDLRKTWNYTKFFSSYNAQLNEHDDLLHDIAQRVSGHVALMCYERNPQECHRRSVADRLQEITGIPPTHLGVHNDERRNADKTPVLDSGKSISST